MIFVTSYVGSAKTRLITDQNLIKQNIGCWFQRFSNDFLCFPRFFLEKKTHPPRLQQSFFENWGWLNSPPIHPSNDSDLPEKPTIPDTRLDLEAPPKKVGCPKKLRQGGWVNELLLPFHSCFFLPPPPPNKLLVRGFIPDGNTLITSDYNCYESGVMNVGCI